MHRGDAAGGPTGEEHLVSVSQAQLERRRNLRCEHAPAAQVERLAVGHRDWHGTVASKGSAVAVVQMQPMKAGKSRIDSFILVHRAGVRPEALRRAARRALEATRAALAAMLIIAPSAAVEKDEPGSRSGRRVGRLVPEARHGAVEAVGAQRERAGRSDAMERGWARPFAHRGSTMDDRRQVQVKSSLKSSSLHKILIRFLVDSLLPVQSPAAADGSYN